MKSVAWGHLSVLGFYVRPPSSLENGLDIMPMNGDKRVGWPPTRIHIKLSPDLEVLELYCMKREKLT